MQILGIADYNIIVYKRYIVLASTTMENCCFLDLIVFKTHNFITFNQFDPLMFFFFIAVQ